jgi:hypothetical protein
LGRAPLEMVRAGTEVLSKGTILLADGYGPVSCGELRREGKTLNHYYVVKITNEVTLEIPSDRGGYVRIHAEECEFLSLFEESNQVEK